MGVPRKQSVSYIGVHGGRDAQGSRGGAVYRGAQGCGVCSDGRCGVSGCRGTEVHGAGGRTGSGRHGNRGAWCIGVRGAAACGKGSVVYRGAWEAGCVVYRGAGAEESGVPREWGAGFTWVRSAP